jgi:hypothetical protein
MAPSLDGEASATDATDACMRPTGRGRSPPRDGRASPPMLTNLLTRPAETHRDGEVQAGTALRYPSC